MTQTPIEYEVLNFEGMARRANYRVIAFREDILIAFDRKDAAAMLFNVIYRWMERKRDEVLAENARRLKQGIAPLTNEEVEERMWVYMSYNDFARETGGACSYNTVISTLKYLVSTKKVLDRRKNHDPHFADYEYRINREVVTKLLNALPAQPKTYTKIGTPKQKDDNSTNFGTTSTNFGTSTTNSGTEATKDGRGVYQSWGTSQESTHITTSNTQNYNIDDNVVPAIADHNATPKIIRYPFKEYPFIGVDDRYQPPVIIVTLTPAFPHPYFSEMEDKRRERIAAWEVLPTYKKKGLEVEVRWEHETEHQIVDAATTIIESMVTDHIAIPEPHVNATDGLPDVELVNVPLTPTKPPVAQYIAKESTSLNGGQHVSSNPVPMDTHPRNTGEFLHHSEIGCQQNQESVSLLPDVGTGNSASMVRGIPDTQLEQASNNSYSPSMATNLDATSQPATKTEAPAKPARKSKSTTDKKAKPAVSEEELTLRKELHLWVNQRRGYSLQNRATTKQIIDENTACITLAHMLYVTQYEQNTEEGSTWDDFSFVWDQSVKNDKYWSQPNNKNRFGAYALLQMFAQTIVKRKPNNVTPMRPTNNPPAKQEQTAEKAAKIDVIQERLAKMQKQAVI